MYGKRTPHCLSKTSRGNRAKFKQNLSVTGALQPVGPYWCAFVTLLDDRSGGAGGKPTQNQNTFLGGHFQLDPSLCAIQHMVTQITATVQKFIHQMSKMPTASELLPLKIFLHIFHAIPLLILYLEILWVVVSMCFFVIYLKCLRFFLYLQIEHQRCNILIWMQKNGPNPEENRFLERLSLLLSTLRTGSTRS